MSEDAARVDFECIDFSSYCEKLDRYAFLVRVDDPNQSLTQ